MNPPESPRDPRRDAERDPSNEDVTDRDWLDELRAPTHSPDDTPAQREAHALHRALQAERDQLDMKPEFQALADPALQEHRLQELLFELRRRNLLAPTRPAWRRWLPAAGLAVAALAAWLVVGPMLTPPAEVPYPEPPVWRGGATHSLTASEPRRAAEQLARELVRAGAESSLYQEEDRFVIDADLPAPPPSAAVALLRARGIEARAGVIRIEIAVSHLPREREERPPRP